jgi:2-(1,2-epoxy-1,2-dihydrophenyl)acetyl-CoA isomerase
MSYETILFEVDSGIARLTLNRPDKLNSFNVQMHGEVRHALSSVPASGARVLVLSGAGRGFCAGQDLSDRAVAPSSAASATSAGVDLGESLENRYNPLVRTLRELPMPVIAAVNGVAAGAGASIALACDIVIAARSASFVQAFSKLGLIPDSGGTWILPRLVGDARAMGLTLLGNKLPAEQAAAWGMIWQCVEDTELTGTVDALAKQFAVAPTRGLAATKAALHRSWQHSFAEQLDIERDMQRELGRTTDYVEGVAAFAEKRTPRFTGR